MTISPLTSTPLISTMTGIGSNKPEIEHVKRIFQNAGNLITVYQRNADPNELLNAIQGDIDYLRQHFERTQNSFPVQPDQTRTPRPTEVRLSVPTRAGDDSGEEWEKVDHTFNTTEFKQKFGLTKKKFQDIRVNAQTWEANNKHGTWKLIMDRKITGRWLNLTAEQKVDQVARIKKGVLEIPKEWGSVGINYQAFRASDADTSLVLDEFIMREINYLCTKGGRNGYVSLVGQLCQ